MRNQLFGAMGTLASLMAWGVASTAVADGAAVPPDLAALAVKANIATPISSWCRGEFQAAGTPVYAVAVPQSQGGGGGRYLVLGLTDAVIELAAFSGSAELACYSAAEARRQSSNIAESEAIEGGISPTFKTTVVCGFVDATRAECWQYDPSTRAFVKVGGWMT